MVLSGLDVEGNNAHATVTLTRPPFHKRLPYSLPNSLMGDLVNLRKEFLMRKSRPSLA